MEQYFLFRAPQIHPFHRKWELLLLTEPSLTLGTVKQFTAGFQVSPTAVLGDTVRASVSATYGTLQSTDSTYSVVRGPSIQTINNPRRLSPSRKYPKVNSLHTSSGSRIPVQILLSILWWQICWIINSMPPALRCSQHHIIVKQPAMGIAWHSSSWISCCLIWLPMNRPVMGIFVQDKTIVNRSGKFVIRTKRIFILISMHRSSPMLPIRRSSWTLFHCLLSFKGAIDRHRGKALLTWETANEINSSRFVVEISSDGRRFCRCRNRARFRYG